MNVSIKIGKLAKDATVIRKKTVTGDQHNFFGDASVVPQKGGKKSRKPKGLTFIDEETVEGDEVNDFREFPTHQSKRAGMGTRKAKSGLVIFGSVIGQQFIKGKKVPLGK